MLDGVAAAARLDGRYDGFDGRLALGAFQFVRGAEGDFGHGSLIGVTPAGRCGLAISGGACARRLLLADGVAEVQDVDQFFNEAHEGFEHGIAPWMGRGDWAGFPPDCPPGFLGGLPLMPKLRANGLMVAGADPGLRFTRLPWGMALHRHMHWNDCQPR